MLQPTLGPKAAIVSKNKSNFYFFTYKSVRGKIWPWRKMGQEKTQGHYLNKRGNTPDASLSFKAIAKLVLEKKIC